MKQRRTAVFLTDALGLAAGGRSEMMFKRAEVMNKAGYDVVIAAAGWRWNHLRTFSKLRSGTDANNIIFENMYNWIAGSETQLVRRGEPVDLEEDLLFRIKEYPEEKTGNLYKAEQFDEHSEECSRIVYYDPATQKPYAVVCYDNTGGEHEVSTIYDLRHKKTFISKEDALAAWIAWLNSKYSDPVFFTEVGAFDFACMNNVYAETPVKAVITCHGTMVNEESGTVKGRARGFLRFPEKFLRILLFDRSDLPVIRSYYGDVPNLGLLPETDEEWAQLMEEIKDDEAAGDRMPVMTDFTLDIENKENGAEYKVSVSLDEEADGGEFRLLLMDPESRKFNVFARADSAVKNDNSWELSFSCPDDKSIPYLEFLQGSRSCLYCLSNEPGTPEVKTENEI